MKHRLPLFLFFTLLSICNYAQSICGADILHRIKISTDSNYARAAEASNQQLNKAVQTRKAAVVLSSYFNMMAATYTIPVVVHVLHPGSAVGTTTNPSASQIQDAIDYLNSVYNGTSPGNEGAGDIGVQFALATRDPLNNPTDGIDRINMSANSTFVSYGVRLQTTNGLTDAQVKTLAKWDVGLYYNIYLVNKIDGEDGSSGAPFVAGYAQYPSLYVGSDGTMMLANQMLAGAKTLPHEIGHALGLAHPFDGYSPPSTCPANTNCATQGDQICDTDPITQPAFVARTGTNPCTGTAYNSYTEHNFMNYTDVFTLFTPMQKDRMLAAMTLPFRASLASSWARATAYPYSFSNPVSTCASNSSSAGTSNGYAGLVGVAVGNRRFSSGITATDPGYVNKSISPLHLVPVDPGTAYSITTDLFALNDPQVAAWIDYNNDGIFTDATERVMYANRINGGGAEIIRVTTSFTVPNFAVTNTVLRMRVINELSTDYGAGFAITSACYNPVYGQTEDFPVFVAGILPVSWKYFKGQKKGNDVLLRWATASESRNREFDIERSTDGLQYTLIATVPGNATGKEYNYTDHDALSPVYFYRLRQRDISGKETLSSVVLIRNEQPNEDQSIRVTNPFAGSIDMTLEQAFSSPSRVQLIDLNGRIILEQGLAAGQKSMKLDVSGRQLPAGIYLLKVQNGDKILTKKLVK